MAKKTYTAGAASGLGRLQKAQAYGAKAKPGKSSGGKKK